MVAIGFHLFVILYEEPTLRRKFGLDYQAHCQEVPRWIPHLRPAGSMLVARSKLKSRARLEAENIILRQQVIVLSRGYADRAAAARVSSGRP